MDFMATGLKIILDDIFCQSERDAEKQRCWEAIDFSEEKKSCMP